MSRLRMIIAVAIAVLSALLVLQNTQAMETRLLFFTITMPRAVLLFVTLIAGFVLGLIVANRISRPKRRAGARPDASVPNALGENQGR